MRLHRMLALFLSCAALAGCSAREETKPEIAVARPEGRALPPPPLPEPLPPDAESFLGLEPPAIQAIFGVPALVRREPGMQLMQYGDAVCVLDIAFYSSMPGAPFYARHIESRNRRGEAVTTKDCLARLVPRDFWIVPEG